ncbi:ORC1-type DNA replication protein 1 [uncultured archaeon]|nr:ORC1-type DNA replication protein 1 [uncultured archaeon]
MGLLGSDSDRMVNQLKTLPLHSKLILCACINLLERDEKNTEVTVEDVFKKYKKLATGLNVSWISMSKVSEHIKELDMLRFLKCMYPRKGQGRQIKSIQIFEPAEIPRYVDALKEELSRHGK